MRKTISSFVFLIHLCHRPCGCCRTRSLVVAADLRQENAGTRATHAAVAERIVSTRNTAAIAASAELTLLRSGTRPFVDEAIAVVVQTVAGLRPGERLHQWDTSERSVLALQCALSAYPCESSRACCAPTRIAFVHTAITVVVHPVASFG